MSDTKCDRYGHTRWCNDGSGQCDRESPTPAEETAQLPSVMEGRPSSTRVEVVRGGRAAVRAEETAQEGRACAKCGRSDWTHPDWCDDRRGETSAHAVEGERPFGPTCRTLDELHRVSGHDGLCKACGFHFGPPPAPALEARLDEIAAIIEEFDAQLGAYPNHPDTEACLVRITRAEARIIRRALDAAREEK